MELLIDSSPLRNHSVVRASLGAMSATRDVDSFISFLREAFIEKEKGKGS